jgi:hypothetical protein
MKEAFQPADPHHQLTNLLQQLIEVLLRDVHRGPEHRA